MDQLELGRLAQADGSRARVLVLGSSRANALWIAPSVAEEYRPPPLFAKVAHAAIGPFELRTLIDEAAFVAPDAIVFVLSEFDTHRPHAIMPYGLSFRGGAVGDLVGEAGLATLSVQRQRLLELMAARVSRAYRFREVLRAAAPEGRLEFDLGGRLVPARPDRAQEWHPVAGTVRFDQGEMEAAVRLVQAALPGLPEAGVRSQVRQVLAIHPGVHAEVAKGLLWRTFRILRRRGVAAIVVEGPINPVVHPFVDPESRDDFDRFIRRAVEDLGIRYVPLATIASLTPEDFHDLTHVAPETGRGLTATIANVVAGALAEAR